MRNSTFYAQLQWQRQQPLECQPFEERPWWPLFHIKGEVAASKAAGAHIVGTGVSDGNGIFKYEGRWHLMHQGEKRCDSFASALFLLPTVRTSYQGRPTGTNLKF